MRGTVYTGFMGSRRARRKWVGGLASRVHVDETSRRLFRMCRRWLAARVSKACLATMTAIYEHSQQARSRVLGTIGSGHVTSRVDKSSSSSSAPSSAAKRSLFYAKGAFARKTSPVVPRQPLSVYPCHRDHATPTPSRGPGLRCRSPSGACRRGPSRRPARRPQRSSARRRRARRPI